MWDNFLKLFDNKFENVDGMDRFFEKYNIILTQEEIENMSGLCL